MNTSCHGEEQSDVAIQPFDGLTALSGVERREFQMDCHARPAGLAMTNLSA